MFVWPHDQSLMRDNSINCQLYNCVIATQIIEGNMVTGTKSTSMWLKFRSAPL